MFHLRARVRSCVGGGFVVCVDENAAKYRTRWAVHSLSLSLSFSLSLSIASICLFLLLWLSRTVFFLFARLDHCCDKDVYAYGTMISRQPTPVGNACVLCLSTNFTSVLLRIFMFSLGAWMVIFSASFAQSDICVRSVLLFSACAFQQRLLLHQR